MAEVVEAEVLEAGFEYDLGPGGGDVGGAAAVSVGKDVGADDDAFFLFDVEDVEKVLGEGEDDDGIKLGAAGSSGRHRGAG